MSVKTTDYPPISAAFASGDKFDVSKLISPGVYESQQYDWDDLGLPDITAFNNNRVIVSVSGAIVESGIYYDANSLGFGITSLPHAPIDIVNTGEAMRIGYDASHYQTITPESNGSIAYALTGTSPLFKFNNQTVITSVVGAQLKTSYDASNYMTVTVSSANLMTFDGGVSGSKFKFNKWTDVYASTGTATNKVLNVGSSTLADAFFVQENGKVFLKTIPATRVIFTEANGELTHSQNITYDGSQLKVIGSLDAVEINNSSVSGRAGFGMKTGTDDYVYFIRCGSSLFPGSDFPNSDIPHQDALQIDFKSNSNRILIKDNSTFFAPSLSGGYGVHIYTDINDGGVKISKISDINSPPDSSALLDLISDEKGFLPPRMTEAERTAISSPAIGLTVYQTDNFEGIWIKKSSGWENISVGNKVTTVSTSTYTILTTDRFIHVTYTSTGAVTITLPEATDCWNNTDSIGMEFIISDSGANSSVNNITINRAGADTITDTLTGQTSSVLAIDGAILRIQATSSSTWKVYS